MFFGSYAHFFTFGSLFIVPAGSLFAKSGCSQLIATQNRINYILDRRKLTQDDQDYLNVLGTLVYDYEQKHEPTPVLKGIKLLKALMVEDNIQEKDLVHIFSSESLVGEVLNDNRELTATQIQKLAEFFHLSPAVFLE